MKGFVPCFLLSSSHFQQWQKADRPKRGGSAFERLEPPFVDRALLGLSSIGLGVANIIAGYAVVAPVSTYICPSSSYANILLPWANVGLWSLLLHTMTNVIESHDRWKSSSDGKPFVQGVGLVLIVGCEPPLS